MSFCPNCNANLPDDSRFCTECGADLSAAQVEVEAAPAEAAKPAKISKSLAVQSMIFGIVALYLALCCFSWSFIICLPVALVFRSLSLKRRTAWLDLAGEDVGFTKVGNIMCKIALPVAIVFSALFAVYGIVYMVMYVVALGGAVGGAYIEGTYLVDAYEEIFDFIIEFFEGILDALGF